MKMVSLPVSGHLRACSCSKHFVNVIANSTTILKKTVASFTDEKTECSQRLSNLPWVIHLGNNSQDVFLGLLCTDSSCYSTLPVMVHCLSDDTLPPPQYQIHIYD